MTFWTWSTTAASNASADATINWAEGQAPSSVNDSARAMMTALAKFRDDLAGLTATGGSGAAYTLASSQGFTALTSACVTGFRVHATNTGTCTINVDGLGAKPLRPAASTEFIRGQLVAGT